MNPSVSIRSANHADLPEILAIVNHAIVHTTAIYDYEPHSLASQTFWYEDKLAHGFPVIVAIQNNQVIGFGAYGPFRYRAAYQYTVEHSVYVKETLTGNGVGKLLLAELIKLAKAQGMHTMIGGIDASNTGSINFHKKFGFKEAGVISQAGFKFGKWLDLMFMQLILD